MERQKHGFLYEEKIKNKFELEEREYTDKWDLNDKNGIKWVIKTFKKDSELPLSDIFINNGRDEDFIIQIGIWEKEKTNIIEEFNIFVDLKKWKKQFEFKHYEKLKNWITNEVKNTYEYDEKWEKEVTDWKKIWGEERIVQPRFKRDHKKQRRIQSAVSYKNLHIFLKSVKK